MAKTRNYGIDLLRVVAMLYVVTLHSIGPGGILAAAYPDHKLLSPGLCRPAPEMRFDMLKHGQRIKLIEGHAHECSIRFRKSRKRESASCGPGAASGWN